MKFLLGSILSLFLSFTSLAQGKQSKSAVKRKTNTEEPAKPVQNADFNTISIDTIHVVKGKPSLLLIDIMAQNEAGNKDIREEKEVLSNFDKNKFQIINISRHSVIVFENNQTLNLSDLNSTYSSKAFWNGKIKEQIQTENGLQNSTEFFAKQLKTKKESSYITNAKKYKKELAQLTKKNSITENSKKVMNAFLLMFSSPILEDIKVTNSLNQDLNKVKEIKAYFSEKKVKKYLCRSIEFNQQNQPIALKSFKESNKIEAELYFEYENGMLTKINQFEIPSLVSYNDTKMIITRKLQDGQETKIYWLENDELLEKTYQLATDDNLAYHNTIIEDKLENNCKSKSYNEVVFSKICFSKKNEFPYFYSTSSYQNTNVMQDYKVKLIQKNKTTYDKYISETEDSKENYQLFGTFQVNEKNQITSYKFLKDKVEKTIKIEYTYFQ